MFIINVFKLIMESILEEYRTTILNTLIGKLNEISEKDVSLRNKEFRTCIEESHSLVTSILENYRSILRRKEIKSRNNVVMLQGEIDFNEYSDVASKLTECGFKKYSVGEYDGKLYDSYKNNTNFIVVLPKSKA